MNIGVFAGNVARVNDLKTIGDSCVLNFVVAVNEHKKGEKVTHWVDCAIWGKRAESLAPYIVKGVKVSVSGQVGIRTYEGKSGFGATFDLRVQDITLLGGGEEAPQQPAANEDTPF